MKKPTLGGLGQNEPKRTQTNPISKTRKMNVNSLTTKYYENICLWEAPENKPKTNPILEKAQMNVTTCSTSSYQNQPRSGSKSNSNPISEMPRMSVTFGSTKDYENQVPWGSKSNQTRAGITPNPPLLAAIFSTFFLRFLPQKKAPRTALGVVFALSFAPYRPYNADQGLIEMS
jgi:hypothetical protein